MSDALNSIVDRRSANHGLRTAVAAVGLSAVALPTVDERGRLLDAPNNFVAVTFALTFSILPSADAIGPADALTFAINLPSLMSILPLTCAEPVTRCGRLAVAG